MRIPGRFGVVFLSLGLMTMLCASSSVWARPTVNTPPVISGTAPTQAEAGRLYSFLPQAFDPNGDRLTFTISNRPVWAAFDRKTGRLSGTPAPSQVGSYLGIRIQVSDRLASSSLAPFTITVTRPAATNTSPAIAGTPATSVRVGSPYTFIPAAWDAEGDPLTFSIINQPAWALFDATNGALTGTPTQAHVGTTTSIAIRVTDGSALVSLQPFDLTVLPPNEATLAWAPPSVREDGTALMPGDLAGYRIYHGPAPDQLSPFVTAADASATRYTVRDLAPGIHYFAVSVYDTLGMESTPSDALPKVIQ